MRLWMRLTRDGLVRALRAAGRDLDEAVLKTRPERRRDARRA